MLSSQGVAPIGASERVAAINTNGQPQLEGTEQKTQEVALVTNISIKELRKTLTQDVANLTEEIQQEFQKLSDAAFERVETFLAHINLGNQTYQTEGAKLKDDQEVRKSYRLTRETDQASLQKITSSYEKTQTLFQSRIKILQEVIAKHNLEKALLRERIEGKTSVWESLSWSYRYGATYHLGETKEALKMRRVAPTAERKDSMLESIMVGEPVPIRSDITNLSLHFEVLCEEVIVYNEALKAVPKSSALPLLHFQRHTQQYKILLEEWNKLKEDHQKRLEQLTEEIAKNESVKENSDLLNSLQKEKFELSSHQKIINKYTQEIAVLLKHRQDQFSLIISEEMIERSPLSTEDTESQRLLQWSVELKEKSAIHCWEKYSSVASKYETFIQASKEKAELDRDFKAFKTEAYPQRVKLLETALASYQSYIETMGLEEKKINRQMRALSKAIEKREKWQIDPPVETDEKEKDAKAVSSEQQGWSFWPWSSKAPASSKQDEVKKESVAEVGEAKTDESVEKEDVKEVEQEVKVQEGAPATSNT